MTNEPSKQEVEQLIENNPEAVKAATPADNPIHQEAEQVTDGDKRTTEANNAKVEKGIKALSNEEEYRLNHLEPELYPYEGVFQGDRQELLNSAIDQQEKWGGNFDQRDVPTIYNLKGSPEFGEDPNLVKNNFAAVMQQWRHFNDTNESDYLASADEDKRKLWRKHEKWRKGLEKAIAKDKAEHVAEPVVEPDYEGALEVLRESFPDYDVSEKDIDNIADWNGKEWEMKEGFDELDNVKDYLIHRKGLEKAIAKDKAEPVVDKVEEVIEEHPEVVKSDPLMPKEAKKEATQVTDGDARTDEANNEAVEKTIEKLSEDFDTVDDLYDYLENVYDQGNQKEPSKQGGIDWSKVKEYKPGEDPYGRVADFDENASDFPVDNDMSKWNKDEALDETVSDATEEIFDPGLEDQNQYPTGIGDLDETVVQNNVPEVNENDFVKSDVLPSADNVLELKPEEQETITEAIEEVAPEEDKETYFGMLGLPHRQLGSSSSSSVNDNNEQYKLDRLNHAGASSLGRLGGFSTGSGSVRPGTVSTGVSKPHAMTEHVSSRAGGGNIAKSPNAAANAKIGSKPGNAVNGFVTSNGGSVSSGPVQKRGSLKSPKPTQLPNFTGHTAPIQINQLGSAEDLHNALIERIKGMLDNLDQETRKKLGFSPTLYNYKGTPLSKLDGATLVQLSEMLEDIQNG